MPKRIKKRGQFFFIAALVIVAILFGLGTVYTSIKSQKEDQSIYDLSKEISIEASQVIDNGVFLAISQEKINENIENLTHYYAELNPNTDLVFIYGNQSLVYLLLYNNTIQGSVGISSGGSPANLQVVGRNTQKSTLSNTDKVTVILPKNINYHFNISQGQNFYIVIKRERANDRTIAS